MQTETPADKGSKLYVNCNMCHGMKGEGGIGPALIGSTSIVKMLQQYKNGETRGSQSALMWGQTKTYQHKIWRVYKHTLTLCNETFSTTF